MKLLAPENESYAATVVMIQSLIPLEGCDNLVGVNLFGFQAIVDKSVKAGDYGLFFPAGTQLSHEYTRYNNLYRHSDLNEDEGAKGYLENNRRVRAMKLRGHRSDCLFMPLSSLSYIKGLKIDELKYGDTFDKIGEHDICNKYIIRQRHSVNRMEKNKNKFVRVDKKFMPEHFDTDQWYRHESEVPDNTELIVTQKLHGTSIRVGNTIVARKLNWIEKIAKLLSCKVANTEFDYVFGSHKVIKDINNPNQNHFYSTDIWTDEGRKLEGMIPENFLIYGELIGWTPEGAPIQKNYTYQVQPQTCDLYVYRVAFVNGAGYVVDLAWDQVVEFCRDRGLHPVPELWRGPKYEFRLDLWVDQRFKEAGYDQAVPLAEESPVDEGVCIRVDGLSPYILKAKGPRFYAHEEDMMEEEATDLEAEQS